MFDVSRILAIPDDNPDHRQMGISAPYHRALVARGGITKDGEKAKASLLKKDFSKSYEKAGFIKGDKKLSEAKGDRGLAIIDKKGFQSEGSAAKKIKAAIFGQSKGGKVVKKKPQNIYEVARELTDRYGVPLSQVKKDQWVVTRDGRLTRANVIKVRSDGSIKINPSRSDSLPTNPQEKVAVLSNEKDFLAAKATLDKAKPKPKKQRDGVSAYIDKPSRYESEVTDLFAKHPYVRKLYETSNSSGTYLSQRKPKSGSFTVVTRSDFKKMLDREASDSMTYDDGRGSSRFNRMSSRI